MNKICVYAICKDEMKYVDQWLDSMSEADYIVVLDTGSTDGTYEYLKSDYRVTKVQRGNIKPWRFDVARNRSMRLVPKDANILVCTDFDERFESGWAEIVRSSWTADTLRGHYTYVWSHTDSGQSGHTFIYDKMHTRDYKWYYPVHEVLGPKAGIDTLTEFEAGHQIEYGSNIVLHHYPDVTKSRSSYLGLLQLRLEENPDECYSMHLLAREYASLSKYDLALEYYERTLDLPSIKDNPLIQHTTLGHMGNIYAILQDYANAITCYTLQLQYDKTHREPYLSLSQIYCDAQLYNIALGYLKDAQAYTYQHYDWSEDEATWTGRLEDLFACVYMGLNDWTHALNYVMLALKHHPNDARLQSNYLQILSNIEVTVNG